MSGYVKRRARSQRYRHRRRAERRAQRLAVWVAVHRPVLQNAYVWQSVLP